MRAICSARVFREIDRILIGREQIDRRVREIGEALSRELIEAVGGDPLLAEQHVVLLPILTGAMVFTADLIRQMPMKLSLEVMAVSSYPGTATTSKGARLRGAMPDGLRGKHVVIVDDILDSGRTLRLVRDLVLEQGPASVRTCVLLSKSVRRAEEVSAEFVGFEIPDEFVVGYGLDFDGYYRNLPEIAVLQPEAYGR